MGDIVVDQHGVSSDLANEVDRHHPAVGRRPAELGITSSCVTTTVPRRRDRCSPSSCKRPIVMTLPRLDLSLIQGTALSATHTVEFNQSINLFADREQLEVIKCK